MDGLFKFPTAVRRDPMIDVWLTNQPHELGTLAATWFERMRKCGRDVREVMHDGCPTACVGEAAFGYVGVYRSHVNVGFFRGVDLQDPRGLLEGTGRRMRHVKIRLGATLDSAALTALISTAYADMKQRLGKERRNDSDPSRRLCKDRATPPNNRHRCRM
jgi:hypothetical protein